MDPRLITRDNLRRLAWLNHHRGVAGLARAIRRSRAAVYAAVSTPGQYKPTMERIRKALPRYE